MVSLSLNQNHLSSIDLNIFKNLEKGTDFYFTIQAKISSPNLVVTTNNSVNLENYFDLKILVAEDNVVNQQVIRGILKKKKITTTIAENGIEALKLLENNSDMFDAILMDLEMAEMDGLEATRRIRAGQLRSSHQQQDIPIIAVTAQAMRGDRERCLAAGMNGYLSKPVNPELLYSTLADILRTNKITHHSKN